MYSVGRERKRSLHLCNPSVTASRDSSRDHWEPDSIGKGGGQKAIYFLYYIGYNKTNVCLLTLQEALYAK